MRDQAKDADPTRTQAVRRRREPGGGAEKDPGCGEGKGSRGSQGKQAARHPVDVGPGRRRRPSLRGDTQARQHLTVSLTTLLGIEVSSGSDPAHAHGRGSRWTNPTSPQRVGAGVGLPT